MPAQTIACPECHVGLKIAGPRAGARRVQCPFCGSHFISNGRSAAAWIPALGSTEAAFAAPSPHPHPSPTLREDEGGDDLSSSADCSSQRVYKSLPLAVAGAVLLMGAGAAAALLFSRGEPASQAPPADKPPPKLGEQAKQSRDEKEQEQEVREKRRPEFIRLMIQGGTALGTQQYDDAVKAYEQALKLFPEDVDAAKGRSDARAALAAEAASKAQEQSRRAESARLTRQGEDAMRDKQYAAALRSFEAAAQLVPGDAALARALNDAKEALAADEAEKAKLARYQEHMAAGQAAMVAQRYADAIREFLAAQRLMPGDATAAKGRTAAENRLDQLQDLDKKRAEFVRLMDQGGAALRNQRYEEAVRAYKAALKLAPDNKDAKQGLRTAQKALNDAAQEFTRLMSRGDAAIRTARYYEAALTYGQASLLFPGNDDALQALRNLDLVVDNLRGAQGAYNRLMVQGATALRTQRYADAVRAFGEALRLVPSDLPAAQGLRQARAALEDNPK